MHFDSKLEASRLIGWIMKWFENNGNGCPAILGLSGGKDSTVVAALCARAIGAENVYGVAMPLSEQGLNEADEIARHLGINFMTVPIGDSVKAIYNSMPFGVKVSPHAYLNIPPRIRMTTLYAISQSLGGRVVGTTNFSEKFLGYYTRWGDQAGDVEPLNKLTATEVKKIGYELNLPSKWIEKTPDDGLPGSNPDEVNFGFSYAALDAYLRNEPHEELTPEVVEAILRRHSQNLFKTVATAYFPTTMFG